MTVRLMVTLSFVGLTYFIVKVTNVACVTFITTLALNLGPSQGIYIIRKIVAYVIVKLEGNFKVMIIYFSWDVIIFWDLNIL